MDVSVIIPYNIDRGFLSDAVASVFRQTIPVKLIQAYSPGTCAKNLALGLSQVDTPYYCVLAEDDWLEPDHCETLLKAIILNQADAVCSNGIQQGAGNNIIMSIAPASLSELLQKNTIHGGTLLYKTASVKACGGYDESLTTGEELDLHYNMLAHGAIFKYIDYSGYNYRRHTNQKSRVVGTAHAQRVAEIQRIRAKYR